MFATNRHLFIGMHRTGTTWVRRVLEAAFGPSELQPVTHTPLSLIPEDFRSNRTIVGVRCNPLEWYVSRWAYAATTAKSTAIRELSFTEYLDKFMSNPHSPIGKSCESFPMAGMRLGAYSYCYVCYFFPNAADVLPGLTPERLASVHDREIGCHRMMRRELLTLDMPNVFGPSVEPHFRQVRNATGHKPWQTYYDTPEGKRWRERISDLDAAIFDVWGY